MGMPIGAGISFSQMQSCKFLHSISIPPNTLQIVYWQQKAESEATENRYTQTLYNHSLKSYLQWVHALEKIILDFVLVQSQYMFSRFSLVFVILDGYT